MRDKCLRATGCLTALSLQARLAQAGETVQRDNDNGVRKENDNQVSKIKS